MRHTESRTLFAYWEALRGSRPAPDRSEIEPRAIGTILGDTFILERDRTGALAYRLAGSRICALFGREMKGVPFLDRFEAAGRRAAERALGDALGAQAGLLLGLTAANAAGRAMPLEAVVLPLVHRGRLGARMIGCLSAAEAPYWLGRDGVATITVASVRLLWPSWQGRDSVEVPPAPARAAAVLGGRPALRLIRGGNAA